ncbi:MAG: hypothetical protein FWD17_19535, partial [Polyangiaceae bacterium]|nr:hypothetical protein [Polyangiaceae bacterium]
ANNNHVLVLSGTTPPAILSSAGSGTSSTIPGSCTNCYVTMDAIHNRAWIGLHLDEGTHGCAAQNPFCQGFQSLDLNTNTFDAPFASESAQNFIGWTAVVDPFRNLLLSATPDRNFEVIDVENPNSPSFFVRIPTLGLGEAFNATGEDCTTRIALAPVMQSIPPFGEPTLSSVLVADLMQATFTPGTPAGTWDGPAEEPQTLAESTVLEGTNAAIAVAQGTHLGILYSLVDSTGPSNLVTAIALPDTSGSGTPEITDWVTCGILSDWVGQGGPQKTNAYKSPNTGHAMATVVNGNFGSSPTMMAVIDLTLMLDPTVVTRTSPPSGGHLCTDGVLPSSVVRFILIP